MRLDKYLKVSRIIKRRTVANEACDAQRVLVNGKAARASYEVKLGDRIEVNLGQKPLVIRVTGLSEVTTKDSAFADATSIADLSGGSCTAQSGTIWYDSCLPQIENADIQAPAETAPAMIMSLQSGMVDFICTDLPTAMGAVAKDDSLVILNFAGTDGDFQFADEAERAENVNIGIAVQKGNTELKDAIDAVLSTMTADDFNELMNQAIAIQPEV